MQSLDEGDAARRARVWILRYSVLALFTLVVAVLIRSPAPLVVLAGTLLFAERLRRAARRDHDRRAEAVLRPMGRKVRARLRTARPR